MSAGGVAARAGLPALAGALALALVLGAAGPLPAAEEHPSCRPRPEVQTHLERLFWEYADCQVGDPCLQRRFDELRRLRDEFPDDVHVHRAYQNAAPGEAWDQLFEEYRRLAEGNAADPLYLYLLARRSRGEEQATAAQRALTADPGYPWAHLAALVADQRAEPPRYDSAFEHLQTFMRLCPANLTPVLVYAGRLGEPAFWRERLPELRRQLAATPASEQISMFTWLWQLEFRLLPLAEHPEARERVRADLERLEKLEGVSEAPLLRLLANGWELVGDTDALAAVHARQASADACSFEVAQRTLEAWGEPRGVRAGREALTPEPARELYDASAEWLESCPTSFAYWTTRMRAAAELEELPADALLADVDRYLEVWETVKSSIGIAISPYRTAAELCSSADSPWSGRAA